MNINFSGAFQSLHAKPHGGAAKPFAQAVGVIASKHQIASPVGSIKDEYIPSALVTVKPHASFKLPSFLTNMPKTSNPLPETTKDLNRSGLEEEIKQAWEASESNETPAVAKTTAADESAKPLVPGYLSKVGDKVFDAILAEVVAEMGIERPGLIYSVDENGVFKYVSTLGWDMSGKRSEHAYDSDLMKEFAATLESRLNAAFRDNPHLLTTREEYFAELDAASGSYIPGSPVHRLS